MLTPIDKILPTLHRVKRAGHGSWTACCPAHEDKTPSLSVKEGDDGRVLLHCWAGCTVHEVVGSLGLRLADLYPPRPDAPAAGHKPHRRPWSAADLIDLAAFESGVAVVIVSDVLNEKPDADVARLLEAAGRLADIKEAVHGAR